ncbi:MAG: nuclear transport factor 2 family protein [Lewinellaceae bacterium]|nr:nuclear transport factor 2 family protein [Saprospiraceae bacterium]MCB9338640.1 nuclear transport factor 2 family protein [Lewinellaceae bacterium]
MSTQEIANRLVELCRKGDYATCYQELYSQDAVSIEPDHAPPPHRAEGMDALRKKGEMWQGMIEETYGGSVSDPIVAGDQFACAMMVDWKMKGQERAKMEEICLYKVKDGKIVSEQFFF